MTVEVKPRGICIRVKAKSYIIRDEFNFGRIDSSFINNDCTESSWQLTDPCHGTLNSNASALSHVVLGALPRFSRTLSTVAPDWPI